MSSKPTEGASLIECLRHLWPDFHITSNNQMNPTSDLAIQFYTRFICRQLQIEIGNIQQTLIQYSSCPAAYEILNIFALYLCAATVIENFGLHETFQTFGITDLLSPMRKKFKMSLVLISNCVIYVTELQEVMEEIKSKVFEALQDTQNLKQQIDEIKEKINNAVITHLKNTQKKDELRKRKEAILKEIQEEQEIYESIIEETKAQKKELNEIQGEYEMWQAKLKDLQLEEDKLKNQICDDIPYITRDKTRLIKEKQELLAESDDYKTTMDKKMQTIACYQENYNYIQQFLETKPLNKLLENYETLKKYNTETEAHQNEMKSLKEDEEQNNLKLLQEEITRSEKEIEGIKIKHEDEMLQLQDEINKLEENIKHEEKNKCEALKLSEELDNKIEEIEKCSKQFEGHIAAQEAYYDQQYKRILELKGSLDNKVMSIINMVEKNSK